MPYLVKAYWPILLLSTLMVLAQLLPEVLTYQRDKLAQGDWWRLVTGHFTHSNVNHLVLNLTGLWLWVFLQPTHLPAQRLLGLTLFLALVISLAFWFINPNLVWYVGFSGVLYSLFGAWIGYLFYTREYLTSVLLGLALIGKSVWDATHNDTVSQQLIGVPVIYQAHWYGLILSPLSAMWLYRRLPTPNTKASATENG